MSCFCDEYQNRREWHTRKHVVSVERDVACVCELGTGAEKNSQRKCVAGCDDEWVKGPSEKLGEEAGRRRTEPNGAGARAEMDKGRERTARVREQLIENWVSAFVGEKERKVVIWLWDHRWLQSRLKQCFLDIYSTRKVVTWDALFRLLGYGAFLCGSSEVSESKLLWEREDIERDRESLLMTIENADECVFSWCRTCKDLEWLESKLGERE